MSPTKLQIIKEYISFCESNQKSDWIRLQSSISHWRQLNYSSANPVQNNEKNKSFEKKEASQRLQKFRNHINNSSRHFFTWSSFNNC